MHQSVTPRAQTHEIVGRVGPAPRPRHLVMHVQEARLPTPRPFTPMPRPRQDLPPRRRSDRRSVPLPRPADAAITLGLRDLRRPNHQFATVGRHRGPGAVGALVDVDLDGRPGGVVIPPGGCGPGVREFPPGGCRVGASKTRWPQRRAGAPLATAPRPIGNPLRHHQQQRLDPVTWHAAEFAHCLPQRLVARELRRRHFEADADRHDRGRTAWRRRQQRCLAHRGGGRRDPGLLHFLFQLAARVLQRKIEPAVFVLRIGDLDQNARLGVPEIARGDLRFHFRQPVELAAQLEEVAGAAGGEAECVLRVVVDGAVTELAIQLAGEDFAEPHHCALLGVFHGLQG